MKAVIAVVAAAIVLLCSPVVKAWDCPSGQIRVQAPAGTPTSTPYYDVVEGIAFICAPPSASGTSNTNTNSNSNTNQNINQNSNSNSSKNSSSSSSVATGGTGIGIGGNSSSNSSVNNSGNSNVKNDVTVSPKITVDPKITSMNEQSQGQQQSQKQSQSQSVKNSGNSSSTSEAVGNGDNSNNTYVPRQTATAVAPAVFPTVPCFKGMGIGAQGPAFGASFGGGKIDEGCRALETARSFLSAGSRLAYCKIMIAQKDSVKNGVTMEDCLGTILGTK